MIRTLAAVAGLSLAGLALAGPAAAQTWGQPIHVSPHGHVGGGTPLSELETPSYVATGRWADGYSDQAWVHAPAPVYGPPPRYGYDRRYDRRHRYDYGRYEPRPRSGYRDLWGYNDDRPPSAHGGWRDRRDRDCGCADVYLYDR